ncbi:MAG: glycosyltransferase [Lachnospiraceae bacterium]|nr:glycosyltransferase [Lachnospiraceae bacterium]
MKITSFTILAVCSNTREVFFRDFLESVVAQDYDNWELYIIDADMSSDVEKITKEFFPSDTRVHYRKLKKRTSKAYGTNIGFHFAEGDYVIVTDCHNRLDPHCLYYIAEYVFDMENVDILYSDHIDLEGIEKTNIHVKQGFNKELFLRNDYLGDMIVFNREVIKKVGQVKEVLTEAFMYDYLLRCMEKKYKFSHIPKFLYYKRIMSNAMPSVNQSPMPGVEVVSEDTVKKEGAILGIIRSVFPDFLKNPVTGEDIDRRELIYKEHMACIKAYLMRNNINAKLSIDPAKRFWKIEYDGSGAEYRSKEYILLKGESVKVSGRHYLDKMFGYIKQKDVAVVGVRFAKPFWTTENCGYIYDTQGNAYPAFYNVKLRDGGYDNIQLIPREIGMVDADFCMISAKAYKALGGFDKELKGRDIMLDFCIRARKRGYRVIIDPTIIAKKYSSDVISEETSHNKLIEKLGDELRKGDNFYSPNLAMGLENHRFMEAAQDDQRTVQSNA